MTEHQSRNTWASFEDAVDFHGHACPGLALGYRVAVAALKHLDVSRVEDEDLVAVVENDACSVDAVQFACGCTFGKGTPGFPRPQQDRGTRPPRKRGFTRQAAVPYAGSV